eukprot:SAG22_NODE_298_length_12785_cov_5.760129_15_plen_99_part_00
MHGSHVEHYEPPAPEVVDWIIDLTDDVAAVCEAVEGLADSLCALTNGGGQRALPYPLPRRAVGRTAEVRPRPGPDPSKAHGLPAWPLSPFALPPPSPV